MVCAGIHHVGCGRYTDGIRYRNEILQHYVILHMNVNGRMFQHKCARLHVALVSQEFLQYHNVQIYLGLPFRRIKTPENIYRMHWTSRCHHHPIQFLIFLRHCSMSAEHSTPGCATSDWCHTSQLSSGIWGSWWSHIGLCTYFRWISGDTVSDIYRVILVPWCLALWLLVSCLPVLLLN